MTFKTIEQKQHVPVLVRAEVQFDKKENGKDFEDFELDVVEINKGQKLRLKKYRPPYLS